MPWIQGQYHNPKGWTVKVTLDLADKPANQEDRDNPIVVQAVNGTKQINAKGYSLVKLVQQIEEDIRRLNGKG